MGELGRYPAYIKAWALAFKYWARLEKGTKNILLNNAYAVEKKERAWWYDGITNILRENGFGYVIDDQHMLQNIKIDSLARNFECRLKDQWIQKWHAKMNESSNINHCINIGKLYKRAEYLDVLNSNNIKRIVTKLRIGYNNLGYSIKNKESICQTCKNCEETLTHVLWECPDYAGKRKCLIDKIKSKNYGSFFFNLSNWEKSICLLDFSDECVLADIRAEICQYIKYINEVRNV